MEFLWILISIELRLLNWVQYIRAQSVRKTLFSRSHTLSLVREEERETVIIFTRHHSSHFFFFCTLYGAFVISDNRSEAMEWLSPSGVAWIEYTSLPSIHLSFSKEQQERKEGKCHTDIFHWPWTVLPTLSLISFTTFWMRAECELHTNNRARTKSVARNNKKKIWPGSDNILFVLGGTPNQNITAPKENLSDPF